MKNKISAADWPDFSEPVPRPVQRAFRDKLASLSLQAQREVWESVAAAYPQRESDCVAELRIINRANAVIARRALMTRWARDAETVPPGSGSNWASGRGGKARRLEDKGKRDHYPPHYLTTSGHSYELYLENLYIGKHQVVPDEGYYGSILLIYDLPSGMRQLLRKPDNHKHGVSNVLNAGGVVRVCESMHKRRRR